MRHKQAWSNPQTGCSASCVMGSQHKGSQRHQGVPKVQGKVTARLGSGQACKPVIRDVWALAPRRRGHSCVDQPRPCGFGTLLVTAAVLIGAYDVVVVIQVVLGGLAAPRAGGSAGSAVPCFGPGFGCRPGPCCEPSSSVWAASRPSCRDRMQLLWSRPNMRLRQEWEFVIHHQSAPDLNISNNKKRLNNE
jgi:hypothetical protein